MDRPQESELDRSRLGEVDTRAAKARHGGPTGEKGRTGPVPKDNQPGHHPEYEQEKRALRARARRAGK